MTGALSMLSALTVLAGFWSYRPGPRRLIDLLPMTEVCPPRLTARTRRLALAGGVTVVTWFVWSPLAPVAPALERVAFDARADRRRGAEEAARRVPVKLLFPLVACILPAFAALTVLPLLAGTLGSLRL